MQRFRRYPASIGRKTAHLVNEQLNSLSDFLVKIERHKNAHIARVEHSK